MRKRPIDDFLPAWLCRVIRFVDFRVKLQAREFMELLYWKRRMGVPMPPPMLRFRAAGVRRNGFVFMTKGLNCVQNIRSALRRAGKDFHDFQEILDFGCGCGRILKWLSDLPEECRIHATDTDPQAVAWCRKHLPFAAVKSNSFNPPLPYPDQAFDLVLSLSVLSRLDRPVQERWIQELKRVLKPQGILIATFQGRTALKELREEDQARVNAQGFLFHAPAQGFFKLDGLPNHIQAAFQTRRNALEFYSSHLKVLEHLEGGFDNREDLVVLQRE